MVGSRAGAVRPFPAPASSNAACGFPALRLPVRFSNDFSLGRGGLRQLLGVSLPPCRRCYPAGGNRRLSQFATASTVFDTNQLSRPPGLVRFGATPTFTHVTAR